MKFNSAASFTDRLSEAIEKKGNPTVLGLDPKLEYIPRHILKQAQQLSKDYADPTEEALVLFNESLITAVEDIVPAVKPQLAYYERYGLPGLRALLRTIGFAKKRGLIVIADGKRNDIGSTSEAYAEAWLADQLPKSQGDETAVVNPFAADALTVNAYLGSDGIKPFIDLSQAYNKGIFVLVRTSNPSAEELQDQYLADGRRVYEMLADQVEAWNQGLKGKCGFGPVGSVVGATWPKQAAALRQRMPSSFFLVPGYGTQGGSAADCVRNFDENGRGAIVNSSRALMLAYKRRDGYCEEGFAEACRAEAIEMKQALINALNNV